MEDFKNICRICLKNQKPLCPLFKYKLSGNYAEMLTAIADVKLECNDGFPDKICAKCCSELEKAYLLKNIAERSDRRLRKQKQKMDSAAPKKKITFNSITDIQSEIGPLKVKPEPQWEMEVVTSAQAEAQQASFNNLDKDILIANTVIRKVDGKADESEQIKDDFFASDENRPGEEVEEVEYLDDNFFQDDDSSHEDDEDYKPLKPKNKMKFKKPKLNEIKVYREKKMSKSLKSTVQENSGQPSKTSLITCYTLNKNGSRGTPILLKRPKDATVLKFHPNYKGKKTVTLESGRLAVREKPLRITRTVVKSASREKLVCPVCGILTYTLGNHMTTHQEKKRYTCSECSKSFSQKANLAIHVKQHTGVKDHICEVCGAGFYCQKGLLRHNLIHKGERPFGCTLCPKRFIARCDLNRHLKIHSGYKPYKCTLCTMSFNAKHQLQNHERMHTGERPYTCEVCNVAFTYKVNLNNHVLKVHGINLKFKSIHTVTEDVIRREMEMTGETRIAISHLMPQLGVSVPTPAAHETVAVEYQILKME